MAESIIIPRNFKLMEEFEDGEKNGDTLGVFWGLSVADDATFSTWECMILGPPRTVFENRLYTLIIECDQNYPASPPKVRFTTKLNMTGVYSNGEIKVDEFDSLKNWKRTSAIKNVLLDIREKMTNRENKGKKQGAESGVKV